VALFGHPLEHSRSQELFGALPRAGGPDVRYEPVEVPPGQLEEVLRRLRRGEWQGANVTIPHKQAVLAGVDRLDGSAERAGAANVLHWDASGALVAANTDGVGFLRGLEALPGWRDRTTTWQDCRVLVLGGGGAARGVCAALCEAGARVILVTRAPEARASWRPALADAVIGWEDAGALREATDEASLVVQATPVGMSPHDEGCPDVPFDRLGAGHVAVDLIYNPWRTRFLQRAAQAGARTLNGWPMLVRQAAAALELWAGPGLAERVAAAGAEIERRDPAGLR
jgi:shikimate dehydrogenase